MSIQPTQYKPVVLSNASANRVLAEDKSIHEWYRFVLSFPPHLVRDYLEKLDVKESEVVLDPFAGTGTTLVECQKAGVKALGLECHPMGHFASCVKLEWNVDPDKLVAAAEQAAAATARVLKIKQLRRETLALYDSGLSLNGKLRTLDQDQSKLLLKNSISPLPLHKALALRDCIDQVKQGAIRNALRLAFAKSIVVDSSNLHFGPEVGIGKIRDDAPVIENWLDRVYIMAGDLKDTPKLIHNVEAYLGDARELTKISKPGSLDVVITSPPYPNEKDYTRTTRLESVLLNFLRSREDLRALKNGLLRSNTRNVYKNDDDDRWVKQFKSIQVLATKIEERRQELGKTSGFERLYHRVTNLYFGGMARHLANLRPSLRPGARLAYVVGDQASYLRVMIRTGTILAEIAHELGYRVRGIELFRTRIATATREALREEVVLLEWKGGR